MNSVYIAGNPSSIKREIRKPIHSRGRSLGPKDTSIEVHIRSKTIDTYLRSKSKRPLEMM